MRREGLISLLLVGLAVSVLPAPVGAEAFVVPPSAGIAIVQETNSYRHEKGLAPLNENAAANHAAQSYAEYLVRNRKTGHHADGRSPVERLRAADIAFCKFRGENWHQSWTRRNRASPAEATGKAMEFWKHSPGHERALRSASTEIGVGVAGWKHANQWYYVAVQMFFDTSCLRAATAAKPHPPDRNPMRAETP